MQLTFPFAPEPLDEATGDVVGYKGGRLGACTWTPFERESASPHSGTGRTAWPPLPSCWSCGSKDVLYSTDLRLSSVCLSCKALTWLSQTSTMSCS